MNATSKLFEQINEAILRAEGVEQDPTRMGAFIAAEIFKDSASNPARELQSAPVRPGR
jgi:hypothetical protein